MNPLFSEGDKSHFYMSLVVLAFVFALQSMWFEGQELALDQEQFDTAAIFPLVKQIQPVPQEVVEEDEEAEEDDSTNTAAEE